MRPSRTPRLTRQIRLLERMLRDASLDQLSADEFQAFQELLATLLGLDKPKPRQRRPRRDSPADL